GVAGANVSANCVNTTNGIVTSSATCPSAAANFIWQTGSGAIFEGNITQDLLIGGQSSASALFRVTGSAAFAGTTSVASVSANSSFAGLVVDNKGNGDLFTASSSGLTRFVIKQNGNVGINNTQPSTALEVTGTFTVSDPANTARYINISNSESTLNFPRTLFQGGHSTSDTNWVMRFADAYSSSSTSIPAGIQLSTNNDASYANANTLSILSGTNYHTIFSITQGNNDGQPIKLTTSADSTIATPNLFLDTVANGSRVGIRTVAPGATLEVINGVGTLATASVSGSTSFAGLLVDNKGAGDLFTASSSGLARFTVRQNGNVGIGTTFPSEKLDVAGNASLSGNLTFYGGARTIQTMAMNSLTLGSATTGNILLGNTGFTTCTALTTVGGILTCGTADGGSNWNTVNGAIYPKLTNLDLLIGGISSSSALFRVTGNDKLAGTTSVASIAANSSFAGLVVDNKGNGDLFTASSSGLSRFTIKQNGSLQLSSVYTTCGALTTVSGLLTCSAAGGSNWNTVNGAIYPKITSQDLLIGGISSSSALFRVTGNDVFAGTKSVASISANSSFAGLVVDNKGNGDLFTASSS